jgi:hypothetical protein
VLFSGTGKAEIVANSKSGSVQMIGTPLTFAAMGTIDVTSRGDNTNTIQINWDGVVRNQDSFVSTGGKVTLNSDSAAGNATGNAGSISIQADGVNITSPFAAHADAISTSSGNSGNVQIASQSVVLLDLEGPDFVLSAKGPAQQESGVAITSGGALKVGSGVTIDVSAPALPPLPMWQVAICSSQSVVMRTRPAMHPLQHADLRLFAERRTCLL